MKRNQSNMTSQNKELLKNRYVISGNKKQQRPLSQFYHGVKTGSVININQALNDENEFGTKQLYQNLSKKKKGKSMASNKSS